MKVSGTVTSFAPLPSRNGSEENLYGLSIEGFRILVKDDLVSRVPASGEVVALVSVQWRGKGQFPNHWLQDIKTVELSNFA